MKTQPKLPDTPLVFDQRQTALINRCLMRLAGHIASPLVMLADINGCLIVYHGRLSPDQCTGLAALAAGGLAAGLEIGSFLGLSGDNFQSQLLEGRLANLYTLRVGSELLLIVAFTSNTTLGMVRVHARQTRSELLICARAAARQRTVAENKKEIESGFNDALRQQLDELFSDDYEPAMRDNQQSVEM